MNKWVTWQNPRLDLMRLESFVVPWLMLTMCCSSHLVHVALILCFVSVLIILLNSMSNSILPKVNFLFGPGESVPCIPFMNGVSETVSHERRLGILLGNFSHSDQITVLCNETMV